MRFADPDRAPASVVGLAEDVAAFPGGRHRHARAQLAYAVRGAITVTLGCELWVLPPSRALWIPGGTEHEVTSVRPAALRTLYFDARRVRRPLPKTVVGLAVTPLLRELIVALSAAPWNWRAPGPEARLVHVVCDQLRVAPTLPIALPVAAEPRVKRVCDALMAEPSDPRDLGAWARVAGASERTLARLFVGSTGLTFGAWRQQLRLLRALEALAAGTSVLAVALDLGYESPSAFGAMFRRTFGTSPGRFFSADRSS